MTASSVGRRGLKPVAPSMGRNRDHWAWTSFGDDRAMVCSVESTATRARTAGCLLACHTHAHTHTHTHTTTTTTTITTTSEHARPARATTQQLLPSHLRVAPEAVLSLSLVSLSRIEPGPMPVGEPSGAPNPGGAQSELPSRLTLALPTQPAAAPPDPRVVDMADDAAARATAATSTPKTSKARRWRSNSAPTGRCRSLLSAMTLHRPRSTVARICRQQKGATHAREACTRWGGGSHNESGARSQTLPLSGEWAAPAWLVNTPYRLRNRSLCSRRDRLPPRSITLV